MGSEERENSIWVMKRGERKLNMGYEKGDTVDAYCYGLLVGDDFFNKQ
jgi:hypothetical protein